MIPISRPHLGEDEAAAARAVLLSGNLVQGARVAAFEAGLAREVRVPHAIAVSSGTAALQIALEAAGIRNGEVITTPFTFAATANSVLYNHAIPVFADIDPRTFNIDPASIEEHITDETKAVLAVHLYGHPCDLDKLAAICKKHNLVLIEDCAQSLGASWNGAPTGSIGDASCFSFYPSKNITTGEGGAILTADDRIADESRVLRNQGQKVTYEHLRLGFNFRMTELAAAIGSVQLKKLEELNRKRAANAKQLGELLAGLPLELPHVDKNAVHAWHQFTIRVQNRDRVQAKLKELGVDSRVYYPTTLYQQPLYRERGISGDCPESERACKEVLSLPIHPLLTEQDIHTIANAVKQAL